MELADATAPATANPNLQSTGGAATICHGSFDMRKLAKKQTVQSLIERVTARIIKRFRPQRVILFGSRASGRTNADSDVDLLVVMDFEGSKLDKMVEIRDVLRGIGVPTDILITTPEDFNWRKDVVGTIEWPAFHEGEVLYARP